MRPIAIASLLLPFTAALPQPKHPSSPPGLPTSTLVRATDQLLFGETLTKFTNIRALGIELERYPPKKGVPPVAVALGQLDWTSDGCSKAPNKLGKHNFRIACQRHDFGYRNYKRQGRFDKVSRKKLDKLLYKDLKSVCKGTMGRRADVEARGVLCKSAAKIYYRAVRMFGRKALWDGERMEEYWKLAEADLAEADMAEVDMEEADLEEAHMEEMSE